MSKGTLARAIIIGRMGQAIEVKTISGSTKVANLSVACTSGYGDRAMTSWFNVQVFGDKKIEVLEQYAQKGTRLFIEGELRIRQYEKDGIKRYATEVIVGYDGVVEILSSKEEQAGERVSGEGAAARHATPPKDEDLDEDIPF